MGQNVLGIFYGCVVPKDVALNEGDDALLPKWGNDTKQRKLGLTTVTEGDQHLVGFWVAIGGEEKKLRDISKCCIPLTVIESTKEARVAVASWKVFVKWAKENGVSSFPLASFWIAPYEIG